MKRDFEIARLLVIQEARQSEFRAVAYAWARRVYPWFHTSPLVKAFGDDFLVGEALVAEVIKLVDDDWMADKKLTYYDIESQTNARHRTDLDRSVIIAILRYAYLSGRFDDELWQRLVVPGSGPVESQGIADDFDPAFDIDAF